MFLPGTRGDVAEGLAELVPYAAEHGVRLVLEPLHPMYAADRAVLSTLGEALDLAAPHPAETVTQVTEAVRRHSLEVLDAAAVLAPYGLDLQVPAGHPVPGSVQLWLHRHGTDAMFGAVLRRPSAN